MSNIYLKVTIETFSKLQFSGFKVGPAPSKKFFINCFNDSSSKSMENAFYFILKALFVLKIFKILSCPFGHVEKTA